MPKLTSKDFEDELLKMGEKTEEESLTEYIWKQNQGYYDKLQVLGLVVEPYAYTRYDEYNDKQYKVATHKYHLGILDTQNNQKYMLHIGTVHPFGDEYTRGVFQIERMNEDVEYTHTPIEPTMITGLSIDSSSLSFHQNSYFVNANHSKSQNAPDKTIYINNTDYDVYMNSTREIHNNVFSCDLNEDGFGFINEELFEINPNMKEKLGKQEQKVHNQVLFYQKEQEDKKKELQKKKDIYRTLSRVETKRKNLERETMEQEINMYEKKRKNRRKTTLDEVVENKLQKAKSMQE